MEIKELITKLREIKTGDEEINHLKADRLLLEFINNPEVKEAFYELDKWYA